jgi:hypothetical protein
VGADVGLAAGPPPNAHRGVEQPRQYRVAAAGRRRRRKRLAHLPQDLGLTHHQRFNARRHTVEVAHGFGAVPVIERHALRHRFAAGRAQRGHRRVATLVCVGGQVELRPVAGRENDAAAQLRRQSLQRGHQHLGAEREAFAKLDGRLMM